MAVLNGSEPVNLHRIGGLVVENGVVEDQTDELDEGLQRRNGIRLELRADRAEVHRMFDDGEVVRNVLRNRVDGRDERSRILAFLRLRR